MLKLTPKGSVSQEEDTVFKTGNRKLVNMRLLQKMKMAFKGRIRDLTGKTSWRLMKGA